MLCEVNDLAGQHEVIAENLQSDVITKVTYLVEDIKEERKKVHKNEFSFIIIIYYCKHSNLCFCHHSYFRIVQNM